jgi:hypothetical protein
MEYAIRLCVDCMLMAVNDDDSGRMSTRNNFYAGLIEWENDIVGRVAAWLTAIASVAFALYTVITF